MSRRLLFSGHSVYTVQSQFIKVNQASLNHSLLHTQL